MADQGDMAAFAEEMSRDSRLAKDVDLLRGEVHRLRVVLVEAEARGRQWAIDALRDRAAGTVVGRLLARTNGNVNGIEIAAELADYLARSLDSEQTTEGVHG